MDGGTFAASRRSQMANPSSSTSIFVCEDRDIVRTETGERRKKIPQPQYAHSSDPSRFWELTQTSEVAVLYPQPMRSMRAPFPDKNKSSLDSTCAARGIVRVNTKHSDSDKMRSAMFLDGADGERAARKRSASAPPRSAGRNGAATTDPILQQAAKKSGDSSDAGSVTSARSNVSGKGTTADQIGRWASSSLKDYFEQKTKLGLKSGSASNSPTPAATAAHATANTIAANAADRLNLTMKPQQMVSVPQEVAVTLRRQFAPQHTPQQAPYATDAK